MSAGREENRTPPGTGCRGAATDQGEPRRRREMTVTDRIEQRIEDAPRGIGLLGRIGRGWGARRGQGGAPPAVADPHDCQWRLLGYASLPSTEDAPEASTLMIEGCCLCPTVRSAV